MVNADLSSIYEEIMWLAKRPNTTASAARAWYTHITSERLKRNVRRFTGKVSQAALKEGATLRLEHFKRIQTTLTQLVDRHTKDEIYDPEEFVRIVLEYEQVHIVTVEENYAAMKAKGDYNKAKIILGDWSSIDPHIQRHLWSKMLRGKVSNASDFVPVTPPSGQLPPNIS